MTLAVDGPIEVVFDQAMNQAATAGALRVTGPGGEVVDGQEVIDTLAKQPCNQWDRPLTDIRMFMRTLK